MFAEVFEDITQYSCAQHHVRTQVIVSAVFRVTTTSSYPLPTSPSASTRTSTFAVIEHADTRRAVLSRDLQGVGKFEIDLILATGGRAVERGYDISRIDGTGIEQAVIPQARVLSAPSPPTTTSLPAPPSRLSASRRRKSIVARSAQQCVFTEIAGEDVVADVAGHDIGSAIAGAVDRPFAQELQIFQIRAERQ